jgi:hypothetical protein
VKKSTAAVVTILSLAVAISISSCASPQPQHQPQSDHKTGRVIKAEKEAKLGSVKKADKDELTAKASPEVKEVKQALDSFYASIADKAKAKRYHELVNKLAEDKSLGTKERLDKGKEFFVEDFKRFDLTTISEDDAFYVLSVSTIASELVKENHPKITVPVTAITVKDNVATVDMNQVGGEDPANASTPSGKVTLVKKDGKWLISAFPGTK